MALTQLLNGANLTDAICIRLNTYFNSTQGASTYTLYKEAITEGIDTPCFFVKQVTQHVEKLMGPRKEKQQTLDIQYFPLATNLTKMDNELHLVEDCLYECLEEIPITVLASINKEDLTFTTRLISTQSEFLTSQIQDKVLHFMLQCNIHYVNVPVAVAINMNELASYICLNADHDMSSNTVMFNVNKGS